MRLSSIITLILIVYSTLALSIKGLVWKAQHVSSSKTVSIGKTKSSDTLINYLASEIEETCEDEVNSLVKKAVQANYKISFQSSIVNNNEALLQAHRYSLSDQYTSYFPPQKYVFFQVFRV